MSKGLSRNEIKIYLWGFLAILAVLIVLYAIGDIDHKEKFEFFAYAFPCAGAVLAGGNFFLGSEASSNPATPAVGLPGDAHFYLGSIFLVAIGLIFQSNATHCSSQTVVTICLFVAVITSIILVLRTISNIRKNRFRKEFVGLLVVIVVLALLGWSLYELGFHLADLFIINGKLFVCVG
jgi:uncharacterized membrane protein